LCFFNSHAASNNIAEITNNKTGLSAFRGSPVLTAVSSFPETEASLFPNP